MAVLNLLEGRCRSGAANSAQPSQVSAWIQQSLRSAAEAQARQQHIIALQMQASMSQPGFRYYMQQQLQPAFANHFMPSQLPASALRPAGVNPLFAEGRSIGAAALTDPAERETKRRRRSAERGPDNGKRSEKRCKVCLAAGREAE